MLPVLVPCWVEERVEGCLYSVVILVISSCESDSVPMTSWLLAVVAGIGISAAQLTEVEVVWSFGDMTLSDVRLSLAGC